MVSGRDPDSHYQPAVDGLRAVAIIGVYVFHLAPHLLPGGFTGVDVFFVISGYLITQVILRDKADGTFSFSRFYQRRIARIYPHLFFVAAITLLGSFAVYDDRDIGSAGALFAASVAGVANVKLMLQGNYFAISNDTQPYLHFWTLGLEEQFYLLHPFLVLGLTRLPRPWALGVWPALGFGSFLLCCEMTVSRPVWSFFLLPTRAWEFIVGVVLADAAARGSLKMTAASAAALMGAGLVLVFGSFAVLGENRMFPGPLAAIPVAGSAAMLIAIPSSDPTSKLRRFLESGPMVAIGRLSYAIYLWHWGVFAMVDYGFMLYPAWIRLLLKVGGSLGGAIVAYELLEAPTRRWLSTPRRKYLAFCVLAVMCLVGVTVGLFVRDRYYVNAGYTEGLRGGRTYVAAGRAGSVLLAGDSIASMYGVAVRDFCRREGRQLQVMSVAGGVPLPTRRGERNDLWLAVVDSVRRHRPQKVVLAVRWEEYLCGADRVDLCELIAPVVEHASEVILITSVPKLPEVASRDSIRAGARPPFFETVADRQRRTQANAIVMECSRLPGIRVVDAAALFLEADGSVRMWDDEGRLLFDDPGHLAGRGAAVVIGQLADGVARDGDE